MKKQTIVFFAGKKVSIPNNSRSVKLPHPQDKEIYEMLNRKDSNGNYTYPL